jgi:hypothetical protein
LKTIITMSSNAINKTMAKTRKPLGVYKSLD